MCLPRTIDWLPGAWRIRDHPRDNRDQNFGLNELAAVQDVRNDFNLQDVGDEPAVDRGKVLTDWVGGLWLLL